MAEVDTKKQQMEYIAIGILVLIALFIGLTRFKKKEKDDEVFSRTEFNKKWEEIEILEKQVPSGEKGVEYKVYSKRQPLKSPFEEEAEAVGESITLPSMSFQGMIWSSRRPQALINNKVYNVGETVTAASGETEYSITIEAIDEKGIHLKYRGREFIVRPK